MPSSDLEVVERGEPTEFDPFSLLLPNEREVVIEWLTTDHSLPLHRTVNVAVVHPAGLRPTPRPAPVEPTQRPIRRRCVVCSGFGNWVVTRNVNPANGQPLPGDVLCRSCYNRRVWRSNKYSFAYYRATCSSTHVNNIGRDTVAVYNRANSSTALGSALCERCANSHHPFDVVRLRDV